MKCAVKFIFVTKSEQAVVPSLVPKLGPVDQELEPAQLSEEGIFTAKKLGPKNLLCN